VHNYGFLITLTYSQQLTEFYRVQKSYTRFKRQNKLSFRTCVFYIHWGSL